MIKENILQIRKRISLICAKNNRDPGAITTVVVTKGRPTEEIAEVIAAGITDLGENKVQEAILKYRQLCAERYPLNAIKWHMVGHLQSNKTKDAVRIFDLIHSVDSMSLASEIDKQAARINKIQEILVQVNTSLEVSKFGLRPEKLMQVVGEMLKLKNIAIRGLMTIAPAVDNPEKARPCFRMLRELKDRVEEFGIWDSGFGILSMGMTDDFSVAIEEGSNMVRLGRAIFAG